MIRRIVIGLITVLTLSLLVSLVIASQNAGAAITEPQAQFFHASLAAQTLPDNGSTTVATIPFTTTRTGTLDLVSLQSVTMNGTCCGSFNQDDSITAMVYLDNTLLTSISKSTTNGGAFSTSVDITTTCKVLAGTHSLTVVYVTSTNPNPPPHPGMIVVFSGTLSLEAMTPAKSN